MHTHRPLVKRVLTWILVLVATALLLVACNAGQGSSDENGEPAESAPAAVVAARDALAAELKVEPESVTIDSYEQVEWTDSCLGLGGAAESCLAASFPGWQVMLTVDGQTYEVRIDEAAEIVRIKE